MFVVALGLNVCMCVVVKTAIEIKSSMIQHQKLIALHSTYFYSGNCTSPPFYESSGLCVETCPTNEFGNHTSGQCEQCKYGFNFTVIIFLNMKVSHKYHYLKQVTLSHLLSVSLFSI